MGEPNAMDEVVPIFHSRDNVDESKSVSLFVASINSLLQLDLMYAYTAVRQSCMFACNTFLCASLADNVWKYNSVILLCKCILCFQSTVIFCLCVNRLSSGWLITTNHPLHQPHLLHLILCKYPPLQPSLPPTSMPHLSPPNMRSVP